MVPIRCPNPVAPRGETLASCAGGEKESGDLIPEMWAYCDPCGRSFYVTFATGEEMARTRCPVCAAEPASFEMRTESSAFYVSVEDPPRVG